MKIRLEIIGVLLMLLALLHGIFPKYFNWKTELKQLSLMNRQMMKVHTFFIGLVVFLMGVLCFSSATALIETPLGKTISAGLAIFWTARLCIQFFGYSSALWKGKTFETIVHIVFSALWIYLSVVFSIIAFFN